MRRPARDFSFVILLHLLFDDFALVAGDGISCYGVNGIAYTNQQQCPNSHACCGVAAQCMDNRLCKNPEQTDGRLIRGPCLDYPYNFQECGQVCLRASGVTPRSMGMNGSARSIKNLVCLDYGRKTIMTDIMKGDLILSGRDYFARAE